MCASEVLRTWQTFRVGLDQESSEVRDQAIDLCSLVGPPLLYLRIKRIGCLQSA